MEDVVGEQAEKFCVSSGGMDSSRCTLFPGACTCTGLQERHRVVKVHPREGGKPLEGPKVGFGFADFRIEFFDFGPGLEIGRVGNSNVVWGVRCLCDYVSAMSRWCKCKHVGRDHSGRNSARPDQLNNSVGILSWEDTEIFTGEDGHSPATH